MPSRLPNRAVLRAAAIAPLLNLLFLFTGPVAAQDAAAVPAFVGSAACTDCHRSEAEAWAGSQHALAWTPPDADHILADFENTEFTHNGVTTRFTHEGGTYFIETDGPDGAMTRYPVAGVAGIAPLQQYLVETEPGRLQALDIAWDVENRRWYHMYPAQVNPPGNGLHWSGPYKTWNSRCAECHATDYRKRYDAETKSFHSSQAEIGVGCEACHGPGEAHLAWAAASGSGGAYEPGRWSGIGLTGFTMDFSAPERLIQQCAGCHSRREPLMDGDPLPGTPYHDAYRLNPLTAGLYHPDGQILDEVYVYGSFLQSKMYARGVACTNCHDPHSATTWAEGNAVCTQCHSPAGNAEFPTLTLKGYDDPSHHFHEAGTPGAECKSCHMIQRVYMGIDGRRDHSFRVPRPDLTITTGAPNACNDCHADRTPEWAVAEIGKRFPDPAHRGPHYGTAFAAARQDPVAAAEALMAIVEAGDMPGIVRATALDLLAAASTPEIAARMEPALSDPDPLVRAAAVPVQLGAAPADAAVRIAGLLGDDMQSVRIAAARIFMTFPIAHLPPKIAADFDRSMGDWQRSIGYRADYPETQLVLAGIGLTQRNFEAAIAAFREAVTLDPQLEQAWSMIVRIQAAFGDIPAAKATLAEALTHNPGSVPLTELGAGLN